MSATEADKAKWRSLLVAACQRRELSVTAHTFLRRWETFSKPVALACNDGNEYVVKGRQVGRAIVNDHIIAHLGFALGAPVGEPRTVEVPEELIKLEPQLSHMPSGVAHGTLRIKDCSERQGIMYGNVPENRPRFALLAVLYGWVQANDHQLIYLNGEPRLVYSVDHGHFFPGGPNWNAKGLASASPAQLDSSIMSTCGLTKEETQKSLLALKSLDEAAIIKAISSPLDEWGLTQDERVELAGFFLGRRETLLSQLSGTISAP